MVPQAEANLKIDPRQRAIWGHSYGGLFVLDAWRKSDLFHIFIPPARRSARHSSLRLKTATTSMPPLSSGNRCICWRGWQSPWRAVRARGFPGGFASDPTAAGGQRLAGGLLALPWLTHGQMFEVSCAPRCCTFRAGSACASVMTLRPPADGGRFSADRAGV
jgi:hypothetical protein